MRIHTMLHGLKHRCLLAQSMSKQMGWGGCVAMVISWIHAYSNSISIEGQVGWLTGPSMVTRLIDSSTQHVVSPWFQVQRATDILSTEMEKQNPRGSFNPTLISLISNNNSIQSRPSCFILFNLGAHAELFMASWVGHPSFYVSIAGKTRN